MYLEVEKGKRESLPRRTGDVMVMRRAICECDTQSGRRLKRTIHTLCTTGSTQGLACSSL